ncbi:MAG TPA: hypothetical protein VHM23_16320, partial [Actinomycetota bacterium]|nr:hypothetical protein [Actinomycetota bacterium]
MLAADRRQQELAWIGQLVQDIEAVVEESGGLRRPGWAPAMWVVELTGSSRLTQAHGDQVAGDVAQRPPQGGGLGRAGTGAAGGHRPPSTAAGSP